MGNICQSKNNTKFQEINPDEILCNKQEKHQQFNSNCLNPRNPFDLSDEENITPSNLSPVKRQETLNPNIGKYKMEQFQHTPVNQQSIKSHQMNSKEDQQEVRDRVSFTVFNKIQHLEVYEQASKNIEIQIKKNEQLKTLTLIESSTKKKSLFIKPRSSISISVDLFVNIRKQDLSNNYETVEKLGQGSYGSVWKVIHKNSNLTRAMKQILKKNMIVEDHKKMFYEMQILKKLDHPNIVKLHELYEDSNNYYLITEYLPGQELFKKIRDLSYFSEKKAQLYMIQILRAVAHCHDNNIVHRDLKPENILFTHSEAESLKIIDFGTSRRIEKGQRLTKKLGTVFTLFIYSFIQPYYIAPEVLSTEYNEKCDLWSCGVIMYIMLCGYPPFNGKNDKEIFSKIRKGQFRFDQRRDWSLISSDAKDLITRLLTVDYNARISAKEALNHKWIQKFATEKMISQDALLNLVKFDNQSIFQKAILTYIASQLMVETDIKELQKTFVEMDKNNDGYLCKDELVDAYEKILVNSQDAKEEVEMILQFVDINFSGQIDYSEFLMAAMNRERISSNEKVKQAFRMLDVNRDGILQKEELEEAMGPLGNDVWEQIVNECDLNHDGEINEEEFIKAMAYVKSMME